MGTSPTVDGRAPVHVFASSKSWIEGNATLQLQHVAALPGVRAVAAMPDLHPGKYGPVGCAVLADRIHPQLVGSDIGCGMGLFELDIAARKLRLDQLAERLHALDQPWDGDTDSVLTDAGLSATTFDASLGSIGGGNHFCELQAIEEILEPDIAAQAHAGQFVHVRPGVGWDPLLRRPYSFCGIDRRAGEIELIVKPLGSGGEWIAERRVGDALDLLGPLGTSFVVRRDTRNLLLVAGGTGIAPMRVIAEQEAPRRNVTLVMGGRSVAYLWPSDRLPAGVEYVTTTDDGSFGTRGRVTDVLPSLLPWADQLLACGPWALLAALGRLRENAENAAATFPGRRTLLETQIAVEQHMGCAMGVCRACVVVTSEGNARVCREGPVFALGDVAFEAGEPATVGVH